MTTPAAAALGAAAACALIDWIAVARDRRRLEYVMKPATLVALIVSAALLDADSSGVQAWFVVALAFSLAGDIFLMLPTDAFVAGLASFLVAHVAYTVGLNLDGGSLLALAAAAAVVAVPAVVLGARIVGGAKERGHTALSGPVTAYIVVISGMVVSALAGGDPWAVVGALLFYASDAFIGWSRFVGPIPGGRVTIMVTYHLGQAGLVLSLA